MPADSHRLHEATGLMLPAFQPVQWRCRYRLEKRWGDDSRALPYEVIEAEGNLLMTAGANALWNALTGSAAVTAFNGTNGHLAVGDGAPAAQTGTVAVTNGSATVTGTSTTFTTSYNVGDYMILPGGDDIAYKISVITSNTSITLATTYGGSTASGLAHDKIVGPVASQTDLQASTNKAVQVLDSAPAAASGAQVQFKATFATSSANFQWNEWCVANNATIASGVMLNRAVVTLGTKTSAASWTLTASLSLS